MAAHSIRTFPAARPERVSGDALPRRAATLARTLGWVWRRSVVRPLHDLIDAYLLSGDLRSLDAGSLADVGLHREPRPSLPRL